MKDQNTTLSKDQEAPRYCRKCGYELRGLTTPRCPECGRTFDPANPRTYRRRPIQRWHRHVKRAVIVLMTPIIFLAVVWLWFYWGWYTEHRALSALLGIEDPRPSTSLFLKDNYYAEPIILSWIGDRKLEIERYGEESTWVREHAGSPGFVLDRAVCVCIPSNVSNLEPVAQLTKINWLRYFGTGARDLTPLAGVTTLRWLDLHGSSVTDLTALAKLDGLDELDVDGTPLKNLGPLSGLKKLRVLCVNDTKVTDLTPLNGLVNLQTLDLSRTQVTNLAPLTSLNSLRHLNLVHTSITDISPLSELPNLEKLDLSDSPVSDLSPLVKLKKLKHLSLGVPTASRKQIEELQRALPDCLINWETIE